jgi:hypothetical protein
MMTFVCVCMKNAHYLIYCNRRCLDKPIFSRQIWSEDTGYFFYIN